MDHTRSLKLLLHDYTRDEYIEDDDDAGPQDCESLSWTFTMTNAQDGHHHLRCTLFFGYTPPLIVIMTILVDHDLDNSCGG